MQSFLRFVRDRVVIRTSRPSLADIAKYRGHTLADLASVLHDRGRSSLAQLEQNPPRKWQTWLEWAERTLKWISLLGPSYAEVFRSRAFAHCPPDIVDYLRTNYLDRVLSPVRLSSDSVIPTLGDETVRLERESLDEAKRQDEIGRWDRATHWYLQAARLHFPWEDKWAYYRLMAALMEVVRGALDSAEDILEDTEVMHGMALMRVGKTWEPSTKALAVSTRAWLQFLRGSRWSAFHGFRLATQLAQESNDIELIHRGLHMGARALVEPEVIGTYFADFWPFHKPSPAFIAGGLAGVRAALSLDQDGSLNQAFGYWYEGVLIALTEDFVSGKRLIKRAQEQMQSTSRNELTGLSHAGLSLLHLDLLSLEPNETLFRRLANKSLNMVHELSTQQYPYALADALITLAYCRCRGGLYYYNLRETADFVCLALILVPFIGNALWNIGNQILFGVLLPAFGDRERIDYINSLQERIKDGEDLFKIALSWGIDLQPVGKLIQLAKAQSFTSSSGISPTSCLTNR